MAVVVCGSGRGAGKTTLVCGLIAAFPEYPWTVVKITSHAHGRAEAIWEEREAGQGTDTARYLAAGARRAMLVTAEDAELAQRLEELHARLEPGAQVVFESNRVLRHVRPELCLAVAGTEEAKPSFAEAVEQADALVTRDGIGGVRDGGKRVFSLSASGEIPPEMRDWLRERLRNAVRIQN